MTVSLEDEMCVRPTLKIYRFLVPRLCLRSFECLERETRIAG